MNRNFSEKKALKQLNFMKKNGFKMRLAAEKWKSPFEILISTIMSARTRDEVTIPVSEKLFKKYNTPKKLGKARLDSIKKIIRPINFYQNKSKNIIACAKTLEKEYESKVPLEMDELIKLPGVGRKTANVFISEVGGDGIGIDTHVSFISQKLNWTKNKKPEKIEEDLKKLFSKRHWNRVNSTLVRFGKTYTRKKEKNILLEKIKKF
tara:strand:+ start:2144 stop:2764 length:621 start_codon:yes stop_codon:yes gene_type:complete